MTKANKWIVGEADRVAIQDEARNQYFKASARKQNYSTLANVSAFAMPGAAIGSGLGAGLQVAMATGAAFSLAPVLPLIIGGITLGIAASIGFKYLANKNDKKQENLGKIMRSMDDAPDASRRENPSGLITGSREYSISNQPLAKTFDSLLDKLKIKRAAQQTEVPAGPSKSPKMS